MIIVGKRHSESLNRHVLVVIEGDLDGRVLPFGLDRNEVVDAW
jgi:hypothetical protein